MTPSQAPLFPDFVEPAARCSRRRWASKLTEAEAVGMQTLHALEMRARDLDRRIAIARGRAHRARLRRDELIYTKPRRRWTARVRDLEAWTRRLERERERVHAKLRESWGRSAPHRG